MNIALLADDGKKELMVQFCICLLYTSGHELGAMIKTAIIQVIWSLPMTAALYFPCKAIARKKI